MDFWKSEYEEGSSASSALAGFQELIDSPNLSRDSIEYSSDDPNSLTSDPADSVKVKQTLKTTFLAKRRLQAYSAVNKFKQGKVKEEKDGTSNEKPQRTTIKKIKKTLYPDDAAKAVIRDIENLKRAGFGGPPIPPSVLSISVSVPADIIPIEPVIPISLGKLNIDKSPSISLNSDLEEENLFKKREIKCRNIRKSETTSRRSSSPKNFIKNDRNGNNGNKEKKEYPSNWTDYKELNLDPQKDALLKSKLFRKPRSKHFLLKKYFNFETPPAPIEIFKCQPINGDASWITFPYLRSTASKPQILYSTNQQVTSPGYLTRKQLFSLIPPERAALIEKLWKSSSRCQPSNKKNTSRKWYPRNWKKFDNAEVKLLEKSVGLSFLQSYSDEEEEEEEIAEDNNEEVNVDKEVNVTENKISTSPSATPQERPKNFGQETPDSIKNLTFADVRSWDEFNTGQNENTSAIVKTPPLEEKEEGEVSGDESPVNIFEDEYEKTKSELASLEEALKDSSINLNNFDKSLVNKDENNQTEKKKNNRSEKESKPRNKKKSKKVKNKSREDSEDETDSSKSEKDFLKKKKQKNKKKYFKDKAENEKRRKSKKKTSKKIKKFDSNSESGSYGEESDFDENLYKKNKKKKKKSSYKSKKERTSKESGCKVQDRKNSVDITHEGYEDDVKFFTARFVKESDLKGKLKHKKEDSDIGIIQTKNKINIDIGELTIPSKTYNDKTSNRRSKWDNETHGLKNEKKHSEKNKVQDDTGKEEIKKCDIKVDLLKKNQEYLKEQDKLKLKQKKTSTDITSSSTIKTPETSFKSEDEGLVLSKSYKQEKYKCKVTHLSDIDDITIEKEKDKLYKDLQIIRSSDDDLLQTDKKNVKKGDTKTDNKPEHSDHTEREDSERYHKRNVNEEELSQKRLTEYAEKEDTIIIQKQPDWDQLKTKRKRHICDAAQEKFDKPKEHSKVSEVLKNVENLDLEKELPIVHVKQEIDSDDDIVGAGQQINTSWETDEELHEVVERYGFGLVDRSLEIPLNIKHFTRREIKVEKDAFNEDEESKQGKKSHDLIFDEFQHKMQTHTLKQKINVKDTLLDDDSQTPAKKRRWDIKFLDSAVSTPKIKTEVIDLDANICHNAVTLENEYEEFLKAVTSTKKDNHNKPIVLDSSSDSSVTFTEGLKSERKFEICSSIVNEQILPKNSSSFKPVISDLDDLVLKPKETQVLDIPTIHIPLPPVKPEEIKPVPVPLPNLTVFDLNKPLINLSVSANVTQNITLSLATSATSISAPITSSTDISKTRVEISTPVPKDTMVNVNTIPLPTSKTLNIVPSSSSAKISSDLQLSHTPVSSKSDILHPVKIQLPKEKLNTSHISSDEVDEVLVNRKWEGIPAKQKIIFATLTLPSKKQLINNSNLNLDDSDNDDQSIVEELKRKKLEALIEDNKKEALIEERNKQETLEEKVETRRVKSPVSTKHISKDETSRKTSPHKYSYSRHESSPKRRRDSPIKRRELSPRRRSPRRRSPRRSPRRRSPTRKRSPHRRRSPRRRSVSPRKGRSISPKKRKSPSPRRKHSISPKNRHSPRRTCSISPKNRNRSASPKSKSSRHSPSSHRNQSPKPNEHKKLQVPPQISSPFGGPKRSVADSTISDDQLPQATSHDDYGENFFLNCMDKNRIPEYDSPKRIPLDMRISQVLGYAIPNDASPKLTSSTSFNYDTHEQSYQYSEQYSNIQSQVTTPTMRNSLNCQGKRQPQTCYRQVGNMLQIVPNDDINDIPMPQPLYQAKPSPLSHHPTVEQVPPSNIDIKPQIVQVGNMLQIVPSEMVPMELIPVPPPQIESVTEKTDQFVIEKPLACTSPEKPSAEAAMLQKIAERRAERENRRQERERRRKEKEKRHKEKEKARQARMKIKTENMIKKALEMEQEEDTETDVAGENPIKWPPLPIVVTHTVFKEAGKSILLTSGSRKFDTSEDKKIKIVQFADGVKPGEGTSPSAGEELSSPPPPKKKLPKEKRYKKVKLDRKGAKKKVKVKIIKKPPSPLAGSDSDNNLPPPSPPPGSPPPHIFPPRIKVNPVNNVPSAYLATIIQTAQQQQHQQQIQRQQQQQVQQYQSNVYCPPINLLMAPPPPPQGHPPPQIPPHQQSPHGTAVPPSAPSHGPQGHFHSSLPPPPPVSPHNHYSSGSSGQSGHHRHY